VWTRSVHDETWRQWHDAHVILIAGTINIDPSRRAECLEASAPLQLATRNDEPGCVAYAFAADAVDPGVIDVFEKWTDAVSLDAHFQHVNYTDMRKLLGSFGISGVSILKYRVDASDPVYGGADGKASATFWSVEG
jgi:quinol monooxygenase YgiN